MATYSTVDDIDGHHICKQYGLDLLSLEPLDGGAANSSFKATTGQGPFVLTVLDNHDAASAHRLAVHTDAMFRLGMPTAEVVRNLTGQMVTAVGDRLVMLKRWIPGQVLDRLPDDLLPTAGELLAELHRLPSWAWPRTTAVSRRMAMQARSPNPHPESCFSVDSLGGESTCTHVPGSISHMTFGCGEPGAGTVLRPSGHFDGAGDADGGGVADGEGDGKRSPTSTHLPGATSHISVGSSPGRGEATFVLPEQAGEAAGDGDGSAGENAPAGRVPSPTVNTAPINATATTTTTRRHQGLSSLR